MASLRWRRRCPSGWRITWSSSTRVRDIGTEKLWLFGKDVEKQRLLKAKVDLDRRCAPPS